MIYIVKLNFQKIVKKNTKIFPGFSFSLWISSFKITETNKDLSRLLLENNIFTTKFFPGVLIYFVNPTLLWDRWDPQIDDDDDEDSVEDKPVAFAKFPNVKRKFRTMLLACGAKHVKNAGELKKRIPGLRVTPPGYTSAQAHAENGLCMEPSLNVGGRKRLHSEVEIVEVIFSLVKPIPNGVSKRLNKETYSMPCKRKAFYELVSQKVATTPKYSTIHRCCQKHCPEVNI